MMGNDASGAWWIIIFIVALGWFLSGDDNDNNSTRECTSWSRDYDGFTNSGKTCDDWR